MADRVSWRAPRTCLVIKDGKAEIVEAVEKASDLVADYALGAGPLLLPRITSSEEEIGPDIATSSRQRTVLGINDQGNIIIAVTGSNKTLKECSEFLKSQGCIKAMNLDGGRSTSIDWEGKGLIKGRKVSTVLKIKEV